MNPKRLLPILLILLLLILPAHAAPRADTNTRAQREAAVARAIDWLHGQFLAGNIFSMSTCDAARVVGLAGENPDADRWIHNGRSLLHACQQAYIQLPRKDAGEAAKAARAALASGQDPRAFAGTDLIAYLQAQYDPTTGFYHPTNLFRNSLAIIALEEAGEPIPQPAIDAVIRDQNPDGCWGWPIGGDVTDTDTSGLVLHALAGSGQSQHPAVLQCIHRLQTMQNQDGGWELSGIYGDTFSNADSTALVIQGLVAAGWDPESPPFVRDRTAVQALLAFQADDGSFWWSADQPGTQLLGTTQAIQPLLMTYPNEIPKPLRQFLPRVQ